MRCLQEWGRLKTLLRAERLHLTKIHASDHPWQMPFAAALAAGLPLTVGAYFDHLDYGLISSLGGLVFLYLPDTPMYRRMVLMMARAFAMTGSYAIGVMSHFFPPLMMMVLAFTAILVAMVCRFYNLGSPGNFLHHSGVNRRVFARRPASGAAQVGTDFDGLSAFVCTGREIDIQVLFWPINSSSLSSTARRNPPGAGCL